MRDVHKWKDKVEFSLDNRQIFFLFFGLSVVGCFVFALGVMVGRRGDDAPKIARTQQQDALGLLAGVDETTPAEPAEQGFSFKEGLAQSAAADLPETRDPEVPPQHDKAKAKVEAKAKVAVDKPAQVDKPKKQPLLASNDKPKKPVVKPLPAALPKPPSTKPAAKPVVKPAAKPAEPAAVPAKATPEAAVKMPASSKGFTLQMKAFANQSDADKLADKLRRNGHDVRVETADVRGRLWYRVRVGQFSKWDDALSAKEKFEEAEALIAYVVRI